MRINCRICGSFLELNRLGLRPYCKTCENEYNSNYRKNYTVTPLQVIRRKVRSLAHRGLKRGIIIRQPCENCGHQNSEMHHEDYDKPLEVNWLCRPCHLDLHQRNKVEDLEMESEGITEKITSQS